jgi:hypothetical protein
MCGEVEYGKCEVCGKEAILQRTTFRYPIKCECHSPYHFEMFSHCKDCIPKEPVETKVLLSTDKLKHTITMDKDKFEHLLNCMCNQKYIGEMSSEIQKEWQEIIDKAYHEARGLLSIN